MVINNFSRRHFLKLSATGAVVVVVAGVGAYFALQQPQPAPTPTPTPSRATPTPQEPRPATASPTATPSPPAPQVSTIGVVLRQWSIEPSTISVKKGQTVKLTVENRGTFPHTFTLSELNIDTGLIEPGQTKTLEFTAEKTGTFTYFCSLPGHGDRGMKGTLQIDASSTAPY